MEGANKSNEFRGLAVADQNDLLTEVTDRTASVDRPEKKFENGLVPLFREIENSERPSAMLMKTLADRPYMLEFFDKKFHSSLLHHAAAQGKLAIVKYLLWKYEANLNSVDKRGCTPLDCAQGASAGNVVEFLRSKGAKTRTELLEPTTTVMHHVENQPVKRERAEIDSAINGDNGKALVSDLLKTLLKKSLTEFSVPRGDLISFVHRYPNLINAGLFELDKTMLHLAARAGKLEVVKWLIGKGAKIDVLDSRGSSPILIASSAGAVAVVDYLRAKEKSAETTQSSLAQDTLRNDDLSKVAASPVALISTETPSLSDKIGINKRFIDNGDGTATDALTGLMWMRFCEGQNGFGSHPVSEATAMSRDIALSLTPEFAGYLDWRLPSVDELKTLVIKGQGSPCIDSEVFPKTPSKVFWSASSHPTNTGRCINFENGNEEVWFQSARNYVRWVRGCSGDLNEVPVGCAVVLDADRVLTATFALKSFPLTKSFTGSGSGSVNCDPEIDSHEFGSKVTLTAKPAEGSIFSSWAGDVTGLDSHCTVEIDSAKHIVAEFLKLEVPDMEVAVAFDSIEQASMKSGDDAFIVYLVIANKGKKQIRVELPLAAYVTQQGEEIEQDVWLSGLINGGQGASIRAGAFRKVGLVFFKQKLKSISTGDQLFVSVCQEKTAQRFNYTLRCVDSGAKAFVLIKADVEDVAPIETPTISKDVVATPVGAVEILQRIEMLQATLDEVLHQLTTLKAAPPPVDQQNTAPSEVAVPASSKTSLQTLPQILAWLVTQKSISAAAFRSLLLPLDLLPNALMEEINERALDMVGESALEDQGDRILVVQEVLAEILTDWDTLNESTLSSKE